MTEKLKAFVDLQKKQKPKVTTVRQLMKKLNKDLWKQKNLD